VTLGRPENFSGGQTNLRAAKTFFWRPEKKSGGQKNFRARPIFFEKSKFCRVTEFAQNDGNCSNVLICFFFKNTQGIDQFLIIFQIKTFSNVLIC